MPEAPVPERTVGEPYRGLRPYREADRELFFARDRERDLLVSRILSHLLTLLFAATGVGKSSLLQAAAVPRLKDPRHENLEVVVYDDWVSPPLEGLKAKTLEVLQGRDYLADDASLAEVTALDLSGFFEFAALFGCPPLVVILDQFEEFFRYQQDKEQSEPFLHELSAVIGDRETPVAVVFSMREDFALELNAFQPYLPTVLFENFYRLERLTPESAEAAIVGPVARVGYAYEEALLEALYRDHSHQWDWDWDARSFECKVPRPAIPTVC